MKNIYLCFIISSIIFLSCKRSICNCDVNEDQLRINDSLINLFKTYTDNDSVTQYERFFDRFKRSNLFNNNNECYRLSIIPPFWHYSTIYEICNKNDIIVLSFDEYYKDENHNYICKNSLHRVLTKSEIKKITQAIEENCFWIMKSYEENSDRYLDPTQYLMEVNKGNNFCTNVNYHVVHRIIPDSSFYNICNEFYKLHPRNLSYINEFGEKVK